MAKKRVVRRRKKAAPKSLGLSPEETTIVKDSAAERLAAQVAADGGAVLARYREPFGATEVLIVTLPIDRVEPTPYQRDPSDAHVKRLMGVLEKLGRFLDPIIAVRHGDAYWTPNGNHRLQALRKLGGRSIVALLIPDPEVAFKILALNTEKAHNLREKSLETIRMARALAKASDRPESDFAFEFEQAPFLTLGAAYEERGRLSGGAYHPLLRRIDDFLEDPITRALKERERRGKKVLKIDDAVTEVVGQLKAKGFTSPYLKPFVVARVNPIRFSKSTSFDFDDVIERTLKNASKFNVDKVKQQDIVRAGGGPMEEE
ncbi:MAG TPA: ParB N-terminal domain-containing protein [Vicinamibacterales bacterium]|nr:ParB N-terminal domain-containing protein [Vicinamibacterales bacterium]